LGWSWIDATSSAGFGGVKKGFGIAWLLVLKTPFGEIPCTSTDE
jgi:hypothetical protein